MMNHFFRKLSLTLRRNRGYGVLNIAGLSIGIACAILIFLWVEDEFTYNHEFKNRDRLYKVMQTMSYAGHTDVFPASPPVLADHIQGEIPEVAKVARLTFPQTAAMSVDDKRTFETGYYCDPEFFSMFSVKFVNGRMEEAFRDLSSIVLTERTAEKFFPGENPVGKTLQLDGADYYTVTAVVKEFPENVSFKFDWLAPFQNFVNEWTRFGWTANSVETIVELDPSADVEAVNEKLVNLLISRRGSDMIGAFLFNMNKWHLYGDFDDQGLPVGGKVRTLRLFALIAVIVIVLACINFMNLATAGAMKRAKEVGVLKAIGVRRAVLIKRFLGESMQQAFVSIWLSVAVVGCVLPVFNQLVSKSLSFSIFAPSHIIALAAVFLFCGLLSGAYPAFFLSSFNAVNVLKGMKIQGGKGAAGMRKTLVVFQYCVSTCLIICVLTMYGQFLHTRDRDWGYRKEGVVTVQMNDAMLDNSMSLLHEVRSLSAVESAGISGDILGVGFKVGAVNFQWQGQDAETETIVCILDGITGIFSTVGIELEEGRDFDEMVGVEQGNVIVNQRMAQLMGEEGRVGGEMRLWGNNYRIIGIAKDHVFNSLHTLRSEPLVMFCGLGQNRNYRLYIKLHDRASIASAMQSVEAIVSPHIAGRPFEYVILEDRVKRMMQGELFMAKLLTGFGFIAILISCFGLLGLIAFAAEQRTREIGIRKVFGASTFQMVVMLSRDFLILVGVACVIAFPVAWWAMNQWLQNFEYRMPLYWWIFALAGVIAAVLAWSAVGVQAYKAATANPVNAMKTE